MARRNSGRRWTSTWHSASRRCRRGLPSWVSQETPQLETSVQFRHHRLHQRSQQRQIVHRRGPDFLDIDAEVLVHQKVSHRNHTGPRYLWMRDTQRLAYRTRRLADDLKVMHHPHLQHLVAFEPLPSTADTFLNPLDRVQDILETASVVPQDRKSV